MTLYLVALLTVLLHLAFAGARVTLSLYALHLGASAATVGILVSLLALVPMLFAVKWGRYIDRVGVRGPMYAGAAALLAALLIAFAVPRMEALFVVSVLAGSGFSIFHIGSRRRPSASYSGASAPRFSWCASRCRSSCIV